MFSNAFKYKIKVIDEEIFVPLWSYTADDVYKEYWEPIGIYYSEERALQAIEGFKRTKKEQEKIRDSSNVRYINVNT